MAYRTRLSKSPIRNNIKTFRFTDDSLALLKEITSNLNAGSNIKISESDTIELILNFYHSYQLDNSDDHNRIVLGVTA